MQTTIFQGAYRITEWITKLVYLNMLWILFTVVGIIGLGIFPATNAVFAITRKWNMGEEVPLFQTFLDVYKKEFKKSNLIGYLLLVIGILLKYDMETFQNIVLRYLSGFFYFVFLVVLVYIGPVFAHYNTTIVKQLKFSLLIAITNPVKSIMMIATVVGVTYVFLTFFNMIPFFSISCTAILLTYFSHKAFPKGGN